MMSSHEVITVHDEGVEYEGVGMSIDLTGSSDDEMQQQEEEYESAVWANRLEEEGLSAKMKRQSALRAYGSHVWCERRAEAEAWLQLFLMDQVCSHYHLAKRFQFIKVGCAKSKSVWPHALQDEADQPFWEELRTQTYACELCLNEYITAKREIVEILGNSSSYEYDSGTVVEWLRQQDLKYVARAFDGALHVLDEGAKSDIPHLKFAIHEVMADYCLLKDQELHSK